MSPGDVTRRRTSPATSLPVKPLNSHHHRKGHAYAAGSSGFSESGRSSKEYSDATRNGICPNSALKSNEILPINLRVGAADSETTVQTTRCRAASKTALLARFAAATIVAVALAGGSLALLAAPAGASGMGSPQMRITASGSTNVHLQIFANINLSGGSNPTGTVTFRLFGPADTTCTAATIFTSTVSVAGLSFNSDHYTTTAAGTYRWKATYSGDSANHGYGPTACSDPSASVFVSPEYVGLSIVAPAPSAGSIHATVSLGGYNPTGTITFLLTPPGDQFCSTTPVFSSPVTIAGGGTYASGDYQATVTGTYKWRAIYSGDANNLRNGPTACLDENAAVTVSNNPPAHVMATPQLATTASGPVATGSSISAVATISGGTAPGGTVTVNLYSPSDTGCTAEPLSTLSSTVTGNGSYQSGAYTANTVGIYRFTATYGGDANNNPAASTCSEAAAAVTVSAPAAPASATLTNPVDGQSDVDPASPFTWTTVAAQGYYLAVGTSPSWGDVASSGVLPASKGSFSVANLPAGQTLYATLWTETSGNWSSQAVTFQTAAAPTTPPAGDSGAATLTSPQEGQHVAGTTIRFTWTTSSRAQAYYLYVGTTSGNNEVTASGVLPVSQSSLTVANLPAGKTLYVTMWTEIAGAWTHPAVTSFTAG
jgi:hypothetical protein